MSKITLTLLTTVVLLQQQTLFASNPSPVKPYVNSMILSKPDLAYLYWNHTNTDITFELHLKNTSLWFAFGVSSPSLGYSDLIVAWLNSDLTGHFSNRHMINANNSMSFYYNQVWSLLDAFFSNDYVVFQFSRNIKLCDTTNTSLDITTGATNTLIFAAGQTVDNNAGSIGTIFQNVKFPNIQLLNQTSGPFNCVVPSVPVFNSTPTGSYVNYVDLKDGGDYRFYWNVTNTALIGEIHCRTQGWVAFGLSPNGGMDQSDVVVGWIDANGNTNFTVNLIYFNSNNKHFEL